MPKIKANGIQIYYELHGPEEAAVLVLSNGILMSTTSWAYQIPALSKRYRLLLYDCRGMWQSEHPPGPYSMGLHAADLAALLDALGIEQAHLGGISYEAEISMVFALNYPEKTRSLIVSSAVSQVDPLLQGWIDSWIAAVKAQDPQLLFKVTCPLNFSEGWIVKNQETLRIARERYEALDFAALLELLLSFCRLDITADLPKITAATMVIVGEDDLLKPRRYAEIIAREIPQTEFVIVPQAGHAVCWEQAGVFNSLLLGFLAKQDRR
ncbi:MAG: alpha/beta fold hydrolase [Chloroflexota bacterium]